MGKNDIFLRVAVGEDGSSRKVFGDIEKRARNAGFNAGKNAGTNFSKQFSSQVNSSSPFGNLSKSFKDIFAGGIASSMFNSAFQGDIRTAAISMGTLFASEFSAIVAAKLTGRAEKQVLASLAGSDLPKKDKFVNFSSEISKILPKGKARNLNDIIASAQMYDLVKRSKVIPAFAKRLSEISENKNGEVDKYFSGNSKSSVNPFYINQAINDKFLKYYSREFNNPILSALSEKIEKNGIYDISKSPAIPTFRTKDSYKNERKKLFSQTKSLYADGEAPWAEKYKGFYDSRWVAQKKAEDNLYRNKQIKELYNKSRQKTPKYTQGTLVPDKVGLNSPKIAMLSALNSYNTFAAGAAGMATSFAAAIPVVAIGASIALAIAGSKAWDKVEAKLKSAFARADDSYKQKGFDNYVGTIYDKTKLKDLSIVYGKSGEEILAAFSTLQKTMGTDAAAQNVAPIVRAATALDVSSVDLANVVSRAQAGFLKPKAAFEMLGIDVRKVKGGVAVANLTDDQEAMMSSSDSLQTILNVIKNVNKDDMSYRLDDMPTETLSNFYTTQLEGIGRILDTTWTAAWTEIRDSIMGAFGDVDWGWFFSQTITALNTLYGPLQIISGVLSATWNLLQLFYKGIMSALYFVAAGLEKIPYIGGTFSGAGSAFKQNSASIDGDIKDLVNSFKIIGSGIGNTFSGGIYKDVYGSNLSNVSERGREIYNKSRQNAEISGQADILAKYTKEEEARRVQEEQLKVQKSILDAQQKQTKYFEERKDIFAEKVGAVKNITIRNSYQWSILQHQRNNRLAWNR